MTTILIAFLFKMGASPASVVVPTIPGLEYTADTNRLHYTAPSNRLHFTADDNRLHYTAKD